MISIACAILTLIGCGRPQVGTNACSKNSHCTDGKLCIAERCVNPPNDDLTPTGFCQDDATCQAGESCIGGTCQPTPEFKCENDLDCDAGTYCQPSSGDCVTCLNDGQCGADQVCNSSNTCEAVPPPPPAGCASDADCPNQHCDIYSGQCHDCLNDSQCESNQSCNLGVCEDNTPVDTPCTSNLDCEGEQICESYSGDCVDCVSDAHCSAGVCNESNNTCVGCLDNNDCDNGVCDMSTNNCTGCLSDSDCVGGVCNESNNTCVGCLNDNDCGSAEICVGQTCQADPNACNSAEDCAAGQGCALGQCGACSNNGQCRDKEVCVAGVCESVQPGAFGDDCVVQEDCGDGLLCYGIESTESTYCSRPCIGSGQGGEADCPSSYACLDFADGPLDNISMCTKSSSLSSDFPGQPFDQEPGESCAAGNSCQTSICFTDSFECARACVADDNCYSDEVCWSVWDQNGANTGLNLCYASSSELRQNGESCSAGGECDSGVCTGVCEWDGSLCNSSSDCYVGSCMGLCQEHCGTNDDCYSDEACTPWPMQITSTANDAWTTICMLKEGNGYLTQGASCTQDTQCASEWCIDGGCSTPCVLQSDCNTVGTSCELVTFTEQGSDEAVFSMGFCL
ncbi:MAG: hypothetical protein QGI45_05075 [Myxococcota bacterium]|jgi:hypothetical protein|nr:hypothetical protein [Myxococcota bacterium]